VSRKGLGIFLFITTSRPALRPTQPPIQWVPGALSLGVKRPEGEADHSSPSSAEVKKCVELYLHSCNTPSWRGAELSTGTSLPFIIIIIIIIIMIIIIIIIIIIGDLYTSRISSPYISN
jgi:hypothetical protein